MSLTTVDPKSKILARLRTNSASVQVNYTDVFILKPDGTEIPAKVLLKDADLDLAFLLPLQSNGSSFQFFVNQMVRLQTWKCSMMLCR